MKKLLAVICGIIFGSFLGIGNAYEGYIDNGGAYWNSWSNDSYLFAVASGGKLSDGSFEGGLSAYSKWPSPVLIANINSKDTSGAKDIYGDEDYIYIANYSPDHYAVHVYTFNDNSFTLIDSETPDTSACGIHGGDGRIFVACSYDGIKAYDFDGSSLVNTGSINDSGRAMGVWYNDTYDWIFSANEAGGINAYTFNGSSFVNIGNALDYAAYDIWVKNSDIPGEVYVFVAYYTQGIRVLKFNGQTFTEIDAIDGIDSPDGLGGPAWSIYGDNDDNVFVAAERGGIYRFSFDHERLTLKSNVKSASRTYGVYTDNEYLYASAHQDGLYIYDLAPITTTDYQVNTRIEILEKRSTNAYKLIEALTERLDLLEE